MAQWLIYPASDTQQGQIAVRPDAIVSVASTADNGAIIGTINGGLLSVRTPARDILKVLSDPPLPPTNVRAAIADPTVVMPIISGTAKPRSVIRAYEGDTELGYATVDAEGDWTILTSPLSPGEHSIFVRQTDTFGNTSQNSPAMALMIAEPPPPPEPVVTEAVVSNGHDAPEPAPESSAATEAAPPPPAAPVEKPAKSK